MQLYERDPTCKSSVDLLAAGTVGMGFYTTCEQGRERAKAVVDEFCEKINLDSLLNDMAKCLIACGNDFWLKITADELTDILRLPVDAVERIELSAYSNYKIPHKVQGYKLRSTYQGTSFQGSLSPSSVIHWRLNSSSAGSFGLGLLQVLIHTLRIGCDRRPAYSWMKAKIERLMPKIFEKYAGPDVLAYLEKADPATIKQFESAIKNRPEEGAWLFYNRPCEVKPVTLDPRAQGFVYYIDHIVNQFYLGCETPLPRLFSTPGFTEASARAALDLQDILIRPVQRYIKRHVERELFNVVLWQSRIDPNEAKVRLNWGTPETPELVPSDLIHAAQLSLIRPEEFRKNAVKFGWELWDQKAEL
ncbi:MAG: hypothetical protein NWE94_04775 [Candidatus Bathyarchaeota archaeon]|nr:hypothetical protein [Candidatus Bathyarchaeota archaeon]